MWLDYQSTTEEPRTPSPALHREIWFIIFVGGALCFGGWCLVDWLCVRFPDYQPVGQRLGIAFPLPAFFTSWLLIDRHRESRISVIAIASVTAAALGLVFSVAFGRSFHVWIGGDL